MLRKHRLYLIDVDALSEFLLDGLAISGNPDLQFSVHIEMPSSLDREAMDVMVWNRGVFHFFPVIPCLSTKTRRRLVKMNESLISTKAA